MTSNVSASVMARLLNKVDSDRTKFGLLLVRYACERFLYRLGKSGEPCILKGATLLGIWMEEPHRTTRDIDLLTTGENDEEAVRRVMTTICTVPCPEDGLIFDLDTLQVSSIRDNQRYGGQRARLVALLGRAEIPVRVDFGFGDVVTPGPEEAQLPTLINGVPAPLLQAYPQVTTIAEKFEAMVQLGSRNSRMKDFYDIWALSEKFDFDGAELQQAVADCFERRGTHLPAEMPEALSPAFYSNSEQHRWWQDYGRRDELLHAPPDDFEEVGSRVQSFLGPVYTSILANETFDLYWPGGGPWQAKSRR